MPEVSTLEWLLAVAALRASYAAEERPVLPGDSCRRPHRRADFGRVPEGAIPDVAVRGAGVRARATPVIAIGPQTATEAVAEDCPVRGKSTTSTESSTDSRALIITFLTDFGLQDDFVGTCHGVIATIAPESRVIDVTHGIRPGHVLQGALVLANTLPFMPPGVHLAVVDPGVGSGRRALALRDGEGRLHVGPDNGLLLPAAERFGGVAEAHELANADYSLQPVSRTFHGRDLFSPAAAHLAAGVPLEALGPPVDPDELVRVDIPKPEVGQNRIRTVVLGVDRFGNAALNVNREHLGTPGSPPARASRSPPAESGSTPSRPGVRRRAARSLI